MNKEKSIWIHKLIIVALMIYLFTPILGTFIYSIAKEWSYSVLPDSYTFQWYGELLQDPAFYSALGRTLFIVIGTVTLSVFIMVPTVFIVVTFFPKWERLLQGLSLLRYGIPPVVAAIGLIQMYASGIIPIYGTFWILFGAYFVLILPFMYQGIRNSIRTVNATDLMESAELLGASKVRSFISIIFPNIISGIIVSTVLSVAFLFGEFVFANLLVGGQFETIQILIYNKLETNGHSVSAIIILYYFILLLISGFIIKIGMRSNKKAAS
ncbi:ABC transporter permease [Lentibacillus cibarius]|uniref:ABC transporter permease subunit n=1 Tax=Lentibacillus cibarius TaxID=2583219 RepID=A0A5S3QPY7_9BACI|nr:ABC transporter permease subunit [Lentibacillus cibarius]TMN22616.1 ABC transporter permease subunit [Lentibacillus cibarius]